MNDAASSALRAASSGDVRAEYAALTQTAGLFDLSRRGRLCLIGADRVRFLHGQVTNDVKRLKRGEGCYAALTTAKGKLQSDLNIFCLPEELLLDFESGLTALVTARLEKYLVADDVQVVDAAPHYGLLSVQGPLARQVVGVLDGFPRWPDRPLEIVAGEAGPGGQSYLAQHGRLGRPGYDLFVPNVMLPAIWERLVTSLSAQGGRPCGEAAYELTRIEAGIPRFGVDMDESNLALECGIEARAISYQKGCYIGQEVLNRIHSFGHVNRELRGLMFPASLGPEAVPARGARLMQGGADVGEVTSAVFSPRFGRPLALGYVRREFLAPGTRVAAITESGELAAEVVALPFTGP